MWKGDESEDGGGGGGYLQVRATKGVKWKNKLKDGEMMETIPNKNPLIDDKCNKRLDFKRKKIPPNWSLRKSDVRWWHCCHLCIDHEEMRNNLDR